MEKILLEKQLCFKLYALSRQITNLYRPLLEELDLTYPQYLVMLVLWNEKTVSVKALGERLYLDSGTLTPLLKRLEQKELITRKRDKADERSVLIELTASGKNMQQKAKCVPEELNKTLGFDELGYQEIKSKLDQMLMQFN
ncbi:MAG: MarR family winged helix-turn-helix transcriptional regulator [Janthinobacterium lividum]